METISSRLTFVLKFILLPLWITGFGVAALGLWLDLWQVNGHLPTPKEKAEILAAWIFIATFGLWNLAGLKKVRVDTTNLYISNFRKEIAIPVDDIVDITDHRWLNLPTTIRFRAPTVFGQSIRFLPPDRFIPFYWGGENPVVEDLKERAGLKHK